MGEIMDGSATLAQIAAYLMGLRMKGENRRGDCRIGVSDAMRERPESGSGMHRSWDTCGTGGDRAHTFTSPRRRPLW